MVEFLVDAELTPDQFECISAIQQSASSLLQLLNDILDLSKIEAGKLEIESIPFNLLHEIEKVVDMFSYKLSEKGLNLYTDVDLNLPSTFIGDPCRIRQIILNIVGKFYLKKFRF
jgi:two-component system sensor histidine kinase/response regulator